MNDQVTKPDEVNLRARLAALTQEHRDLDAAIGALSETNPADQLALSRLKKRKLQLKDEITEINNQLLPDIIAWIRRLRGNGARPRALPCAGAGQRRQPYP